MSGVSPIGGGGGSHWSRCRAAMEGRRHSVCRNAAVLGRPFRRRRRAGLRTMRGQHGWSGSETLACRWRSTIKEKHSGSTRESLMRAASVADLSDAPVPLTRRYCPKRPKSSRSRGLGCSRSSLGKGVEPPLALSNQPSPVRALALQCPAAPLRCIGDAFTPPAQGVRSASANEPAEVVQLSRRCFPAVRASSMMFGSPACQVTVRHTPDSRHWPSTRTRVSS